MEPDITIKAATPAELRDDAGFWQLYATSFARAEREPAEVILRSIEQGPGFALRALADGRTVGLAAGHVLEEPAATFLVYLAVDPAWRSRHLGRALFDATDRSGALRLIERGRVTSGITWEIDDPAADVNPSEQNVRQGRLRFFEKLGGRMLETRYFQPPVDGHTLVPMRLMFGPLWDRTCRRAWRQRSSSARFTSRNTTRSTKSRHQRSRAWLHDAYRPTRTDLGSGSAVS